MKLFHYSYEKLSTLVPSVGSGRHGGEDCRVVGQAAIWFFDRPTVMTPVRLYEYQVEIDDGDPDLFRDELVGATLRKMDLKFSGNDADPDPLVERAVAAAMQRANSSSAWPNTLFYRKAIAVSVSRQWDPASNEYV